MAKWLLPLVACLLLSGAGRPPDIAFRIRMLDSGANETAAIADINNDGKPDIVSGENWYQAPGWTRHRFREINFTNNYVDDFSDLPIDVDGDGFPDVVSVSWFGKSIVWWKNPGKKLGTPGARWTEHAIDSGFNVEFAFLVDLDGDGKARELLPQPGNERNPLAWYETVDGAWKKHVVSPRSFGHGIGAGDVNGDGRPDIVTAKGWLEAPVDPRSSDWKLHSDWDEKAQLGFIHVIDITGDGKKDILTTAAHDYGVFLFEQGANGQWTRRVIDSSWSQAHAATLADLNGDGQLDLVTGKRYMAHNGNDPGEKEPLGVYWYQYRKTPEGSMEWIRHLIDYGTRVGGGMQIPVRDLDGDGDPDIVFPGKSGLFLAENLTRTSAPKSPAGKQ